MLPTILPLLTVYGGPLSGFQVPEEDPEVVRAAQAHGFRYRLTTVDGERAWVYEGLAPRWLRERPVGPWRWRVPAER